MAEGWLAGKTAIVTGAAGGIGSAAVRLFAEEGARVVAVDIQEAELAAALEGMLADQVQAFTGDLTQSAAAEGAVRRAVAAFGRLDVLFNVAGGSGRRWGDGPVAECSEEAWDRVMALNLKSQFLTCKYAVAQMLAGGGGAIVNLSSVLGLVGGDSDFATHAYAASKGGIISLTRAIAETYAHDGIRANVICAGLIATPMSRRAQESEAIRARLSDLQPLTSDFGTPEDVAQAALYLASDRARFVTGAVLTVDGGWTAH